MVAGHPVGLVRNDDEASEILGDRLRRAAPTSHTAPITIWRRAQTKGDQEVSEYPPTPDAGTAPVVAHWERLVGVSYQPADGPAGSCW